MENIAIDTCVSFAMLDYADEYEKHGKEALDKKIENEEKAIKPLHDRIVSLIDEDYYNQNYRGKPLDYGYLVYLDGKIAEIDERLTKLQNYLNGIYIDDRGRRTLIKTTKEQRANANRMITELREAKNKLQNTRGTFKGLMRQYKPMADLLSCGKLFQRAVEGKVSLFVPMDSYDEILNHTHEHTTYRGARSFNYYPLDKIKNVLKHCTLVTTNQSRVLVGIDRLSRLYRSSDGVGKKMDNDLNALGVFGDSRIMAEASIMGMPLITLNASDFVFDTDKQVKNDDIRLHIQSVNRTFGLANPDVKPYSVAEYLYGRHATAEESKTKVTMTEVQTTSYAGKEMEI